jgi:hypothetical protein
VHCGKIWIQLNDKNDSKAESKKFTGHQQKNHTNGPDPTTKK